MAEDTNSISLSAYCTLRPKTNEKSIKNVNNTRFNSLKTKRSHPINDFDDDEDDDSTIPYIPLENVIISYTKNDCDTITPITIADEPTNSILECDLIDLYDDTSPAENVGATAVLSQPEVEAINVALLEKFQQRIPSIHNQGTCSSMSNTLTKKSHHNDENDDEFHRLERYCTLRKMDQHKRKHLLRNISTLRKSKQLLMNNEKYHHHEFCLLHELIHIDNDNDNCSRSSTPSISSVLSCCDPEKIEDCLLELDAYLEEIDRKCMCNELINCSIENELINNNNDSESDTNTNCINEIQNNVSSNTIAAGSNEINNINEYSDFLNIFENYYDNENEDNNNANVDDSVNVMENLECSSNSKSNNFLNDHLVSKMDENIARGHQYRNTISVPRENKQRLQTTDSHCATINPKQLQWRRNSMRKTRPITLPDQHQPTTSSIINQQPSTSQYNEVITSQQLDSVLPIDFQNVSDTQPLVLSMESTDISQEVPSSVDQLLLTADNQLLSSPKPNNEYVMSTNQQRIRTLGDDFLDALTSSNNNNTTVDNNQIITTNLINYNSNSNNVDVEQQNFSSTLCETNSNNDTVNVSNNNRTTPRQTGRRGEGRARIVSITTETNSVGNQRIIVNHDRRPSSAPVIATRPTSRTQQQSTYVPSESSSVITSRNTSPVSLESSSASSTTTTCTNERPRQRSQPDPETTQDEQDSLEKLKLWPCGLSRILAGTCCTLGLFNISRFAIFSVHFGANFIVQFLILSFILGIPMLWLQMCLGAKIKSGPLRMWRISPICKGIGISLVVIQAFVALYSAVSIAWVLVYFRDSFLSHNSRFRWQEPYEIFRGPRTNGSYKLSETVADYFNGVVLQRYQLGPGGRIGGTGLGAVRFQLAFNLAVLWITVFVILCKGLRSYGKAVIGLMILPLVGLVTLCTKMLTMINPNSLQNIFPATDWQDFFVNTQSWVSAAQETFLTWALISSSIISIFSKSSSLQERNTILRRDAMIVVVITIFGLILAAILGNTCVQILNDRGYYYYPGSFENVNSYQFLLPSNAPLPHQFASTPSKWLHRYSTVLGEGYSRTTMNVNMESGFQAIRLVTELFPATLAATSQDHMAAVWSILGYFVFLLFGLGQLCAMWKPIASSLGNSTSAVLLSCVTGLLLAIPLATECGINIMHFFDEILGGSWLVQLLLVGQILAVFLVRGRPYSGDILVNDLHLTQTLSAFVALSWNLLLPIGLMTLTILEYNLSNSRDLYQWRGTTYWPLWVRKVGGFIQVSMLMLVPITSIIQMYRYLSKGPPDILDRVQLLYRPSLSGTTTSSHYSASDGIDRPSLNIPATITLEPPAVVDDAPPKYTPPPSYTTATGARLAKMLRNSIRRSVRRIIGESSNGSRRPRLQNNSMTSTLSIVDTSLPPAYSTAVLISTPPDTSSGNESNVEPSSTVTTTNTCSEIGPRVLYNSHTNRSHTLDHQRRSLPAAASVHNQQTQHTQTLPTTATTNSSSSVTALMQRAQTLTANDVAQLLRPTKKRTQFQRASSLGGCVDQSSSTTISIRNSLQKTWSRSVEELIINAVPPGQCSAICLTDDNDKNNVDDDVVDTKSSGI